MGNMEVKRLKPRGYIECSRITPDGAEFFQSGNLLKLTDKEMEREVWEEK